mgnify:CR=1 FL=1
MAIFTYKGINSQGERVTGEIQAEQKSEVISLLAAKKIKPISIETSNKKAQGNNSTHEFENFYSTPKKKKGFTVKKKKGSEVTLPFLKNLLVLIKSGLSLGDALKLLGNRLQDSQQHDLCDVLWRKISEGYSLADAMRAQPNYFDSSVCNLVAVGEDSGNLPLVLERITNHITETKRLQKEMINNLAYPAFIVFMVMVVVIIFLYVLLPRIEDMLNTLGGEMNLCASILIGCSQIFIYLAPILLAASIIGIFSLHKWYHTEKGKRSCDYFLLKLPLLKTLQLHSVVQKTTNLLSVLLDSGVNTTEALRLTERTISNIHMREKFTKARRLIHEGTSLSQAFKEVYYLPTLALDLLSVGENTGNITSSLKEIAQIYQKDLTSRIRKLTTATSSIALIFAFCLVGLIAASILLSVLQVSHTLSAG